MREPDMAPTGKTQGVDCSLTKFERALEYCQKEVNPDVYVRLLRTLLLIAAEPGITQDGICKKLDLTKSNASRIVSGLSKEGRGFGLVDSIEDPSNHRARKQYLTPGGHQVVDRLRVILK